MATAQLPGELILQLLNRFMYVYAQLGDRRIPLSRSQLANLAATSSMLDVKVEERVTDSGASRLRLTVKLRPAVMHDLNAAVQPDEIALPSQIRFLVEAGGEVVPIKLPRESLGPRLRILQKDGMTFGFYTNVRDHELSPEEKRRDPTVREMLAEHEAATREAFLSEFGPDDKADKADDKADKADKADDQDDKAGKADKADDQDDKADKAKAKAKAGKAGKAGKPHK